jgi:hypothetical protein
MPLFEWVDALATMAIQAGPFSILRDEMERFERDVDNPAPDVTLSRDRVELARLLAYRPEREDAEEAKLARSRWLEDNDADRSFPCGIVPDPVPVAPEAEKAQPAVPPRPLLPSEAGWAAESSPPQPSPEPPPEPEDGAPLRPMQVIAAVLPKDLVFIREDIDDDLVEEVGRLPRDAIQDVDVVDVQGVHVPDPVRESIEPEEVVFAVLRWSNAGEPDEDRFLFRSPWMAWQAAHRIRAASR